MEGNGAQISLGCPRPSGELGSQVNRHPRCPDECAGVWDPCGLLTCGPGSGDGGPEGSSRTDGD